MVPSQRLKLQPEEMDIMVGYTRDHNVAMKLYLLCLNINQSLMTITKAEVIKFVVNML